MTIKDSPDYQPWLNKVTAHPKALIDMPEALRCTEFYIDAINKNGYLIKYIPEAQITPEVVFLAINESKDNIAHIRMPATNAHELEIALSTWNEVFAQFEMLSLSQCMNAQNEIVVPAILVLHEMEKQSALNGPLEDQLKEFIEHCERFEINVDAVDMLLGEMLENRIKKHKLHKSQIMDI